MCPNTVGEISILKAECIHRQKIASFEEARQLIDDYIYFYNHQRIRFKTKLTPLGKRRQSVVSSFSFIRGLFVLSAQSEAVQNAEGL